MLYITTRDQKDAHTAYKTLVCDCAADGGVYLPFHLPCYEQKEISKLVEQPFNEVVAQILNYFFSAQLTAWDVDFAIGRTPIKLTTVGRKVVVSELWHNLDGTYACLERNLFKCLSKNTGIATQPTDWSRIAIRIAVLFGTYAQMYQQDLLLQNETFDVVLDVGDYFEPIAAYYAKQMGLPFGKIIVVCSDEASAIWDLIHRSEIATSALPNNVLLGVERLLYTIYGEAELKKFIDRSGSKRSYSVDEEASVNLSDLFFAVVVSADRLKSLVNSVQKSDNYSVDEKSAKSFGAVQDYRAKIGESNLTLVFSENNPKLK